MKFFFWQVFLAYYWKRGCVIGLKCFYQLLACPKASFGPLVRRQPRSPDFNHCAISSLTRSSTGISERGWVPKLSGVHQQDSIWEACVSECETLSNGATTLLHFEAKLSDMSFLYIKKSSGQPWGTPASTFSHFECCHIEILFAFSNLEIFPNIIRPLCQTLSKALDVERKMRLTSNLSSKDWYISWVIMITDWFTNTLV